MKSGRRARNNDVGMLETLLSAKRGVSYVGDIRVTLSSPAIDR